MFLIPFNKKLQKVTIGPYSLHLIAIKRWEIYPSYEESYTYLGYPIIYQREFGPHQPAPIFVFEKAAQSSYGI